MLSLSLVLAALGKSLLGSLIPTAFLALYLDGSTTENQTGRQVWNIRYTLDGEHILGSGLYEPPAHKAHRFRQIVNARGELVHRLLPKYRAIIVTTWLVLWLGTAAGMLAHPIAI